MEQLAQKVSDFIEPVVSYLVIGSKKAAEEACKKVGYDVWKSKKDLWEKLFSRENTELREAAGDMVVAPSDPEVKKVLVERILKLLEQDPDLAIEISSFMDNEIVQKILEEENKTKFESQNSIDKNKILEEFEKMLGEFLAKSAIHDMEQFEISNNTTPSNSNVTNDIGVDVRNLKSPYTHIQLDQRISTEGSPSNIRMAKIAGMNFKGESATQKIQETLSQISEFRDPEKEEYIKKALNFASKIQYGDVRAQILSLLVPYLDGPGRTELIEKAIYSASNIDDENERAMVLSSLLPHLRGAGKERLIENIFVCTAHIQYADAKFQILYSLVPHLYGSKNEKILEKALEMISGMQSDFLKIESFSLLIPYLKKQRKEEIIEEVLQLACNLKDRDMRPEALSLIIQYLDEPQQKNVLLKALKLASEVKSQDRRARALSSLVPYLEESEKKEIME